MTKINVLVIDDDELDRYLANRTLGKFDVFEKVVELVDGQDAADLIGSPDFKEDFGSSPPTLIFLDINMPRMTGFELLDYMAEQDSSVTQDWANSVVLMLTSSGNEEDRQRASGYAYVNGHIEKPITEETVSSILDKHYGQLSEQERTH